MSGLIATTGLLLARRRALVRLAAAAGVLAAVTAALSITAVWSEKPSDAFAKTFDVFWILAALCYFLVPVLQRFTAAGVEEHAVRVLAELDGVELVASRAPARRCRRRAAGPRRAPDSPPASGVLTSQRVSL